jgi:hypothetical protein
MMAGSRGKTTLDSPVAFLSPTAMLNATNRSVALKPAFPLPTLRTRQG